MSDFNDFGFTVVDEHELTIVREAEQAKVQADSTTAELTERVDSLYNAIQPLLNNLKLNPDKDYIFWPNRLEKIEAFEDHLQSIYTK